MLKPNPKLELPTITNLFEKIKSSNVDLKGETRLRKIALPMYDIVFTEVNKIVLCEILADAATNF